MQSEEAAHLCERCSQICFDVLKGPTAAQLHNTSGVYKLDSAQMRKVTLGPLSTIKQGAERGCSLCQLFLHVIGRPVGGALLSSDSYLRDEGVSLMADPDMSYYGHIVEPALDGGQDRRLFVIRRLNLTLRPAITRWSVKTSIFEFRRSEARRDARRVWSVVHT